MNNSNFVEGIIIIFSYMTEEELDSYGIQAAHDELWFGSYCAESMTKKDMQRLEELGWTEDEDAWHACI